MGRRTSLTLDSYNGSDATAFAYDSLGRLASVTAPDTRVTTYEYTPTGSRAAVNLPNGTRTEYSYDNRNRLTGITQRAPDNSLLQQHSYTLDATGHRTRLSELSGRVVDYSYDATYRLLQEAVTASIVGNRTSVFQYDPAGNRTQRTEAGVITDYVYDANDRLLSETAGAETISYSYDANGNQTGKQTATTAVTYAYDWENRLVEATEGTATTRFAYDPDGNRIARETPNGWVSFVVDTNRPHAQVLQEQDTLGNAVVDCLHGDDLIARTTPADTRYYHYDGLGSTRLLTDETGIETDSYTYKAYGELENSTETSENAYRYAGEQYEASLGYYYMRARYYDPALGRFTQMDSYAGDPETPISLHKYAYANLDPALMMDPSGQFADLGSLMRGIAGRSAMGFRSLGVRSPQAYLRAAQKTMIQAAKRFAKQCARGRSKFKNCKLPLNILFYGNDVAEVTEHISDAMMNGKTALLHRRYPKHSRSWMYLKKYESACVGRREAGQECDEYPFASSVEGGRRNFDRRKVSLQPLNGVQNKLAGRWLNMFYNRCRIPKGYTRPNKKTLFVVVPVEGAPISVPYCGAKKQR